MPSSNRPAFFDIYSSEIYSTWRMKELIGANTSINGGITIVRAKRGQSDTFRQPYLCRDEDIKVVCKHLCYFKHEERPFLNTLAQFIFDVGSPQGRSGCQCRSSVMSVFAMITSLRMTAVSATFGFLPRFVRLR